MKNLESSIDVPQHYFGRKMHLSEFGYNWYSVSSVRNWNNSMRFHFTASYSTVIGSQGHVINEGVVVTFDYDELEDEITNLKSNIDNRAFYASLTNLKIAMEALEDGMEQIISIEESNLTDKCPYFHSDYELKGRESDITLRLRIQ